MLPYTKIGVVGGIMLGLGRALGETMAVTFVIGNAPARHRCLCQRQQHLLGAGQRIRRSGGTSCTSALIELGLILFFITFVVLSLSKLLLARLRRGEGTRA